MKFIYLALLVCEISEFVLATKFISKEFADIDFTKYNYDQISPENIWTNKLAEKIGVVNITAEIYEDVIYSQRIP